MPIDPNIALSVKPVELQNPLGAYTNYLQARGLQTQNALHQFQFDQARQADERATIRLNALREAGTDANKIGNALVQSGDVKGYTDFMKGFREQQKAHSEALDAALKTSRQFLSTIDPNAPDAAEKMVQWHLANHADPLIGPALAARGVTAQQSMDTIRQAAGAPGGIQQLFAQSSLGMDKFIEHNAPKYITANQGGKESITAFPGLGFGKPVVAGEFAQVPLPADVEAQKLRLHAAGAPKVSIDMKAEGKYKEGVASKGAEDDVSLYNTAMKAATEIPRLDKTIALLSSGKANTGLGATFFTDIDRARSKFLDDKAAGKRVESTEYLRSALGSSVFTQLQSMGLTSKNIDTPAERDFLLGVLNGTIDMSPGALLQMANDRREALVGAVAEHDRRVQSGELDAFYSARQRKPSLIGVRRAPAGPATVPPVNTQAPVARQPAAPASSGGWKDL